MMTIKEFASLCGCSTQTLRYYDKIDLLKPVQVDPWSGYRYYTESQAIDFVKIKNLQAADFTIEEIKTLLVMPDQQVYEAFDKKIAEQSRKLERIKEIQQSYLTEVNTMKHLIHSFCDQLLEKATAPEMLREFGVSADEASAIVKEVRQLMISRTIESGEEARRVQMVVDDKLFEGTHALENMTFLIKEEELDDTVYLNAEHIREATSDLTENMDQIWEMHGWKHAHEFLGRIPPLDENEQYVLWIRHHENTDYNAFAYPFFIIGMMMRKGYPVDRLHCFAEHTDDGQNHFSLLRRK